MSFRPGTRYTIDSLIRGEYQSTPTATSSSQYLTLPSSATTVTGATTSTTTAETTLNSPSSTRSSTKGTNQNYSAGLKIAGQGDYRNETLIQNPRDVTYLTNLLQIAFFLRGINVVTPEKADTDVFVTVDVFGTVRSRTEFYIENEEQLIATTKMEVFGVDRETRAIIMHPRVSSFEAKYQEIYVAWMGPIKTNKLVTAAKPMLVDFSDMTSYTTARQGGTDMTPPQLAPSEPHADDAVEQAVKRDRRTQ